MFGAPDILSDILVHVFWRTSRTEKIIAHQYIRCWEFKDVTTAFPICTRMLDDDIPRRLLPIQESGCGSRSSKTVFLPSLPILSFTSTTLPIFRGLTTS